MKASVRGLSKICAIKKKEIIFAASLWMLLVVLWFSFSQSLWKENTPQLTEKPLKQHRQETLLKLQKREEILQEIQEYNEKNKLNATKRLPGIIGIGVKKCGTNGIIRFLEHHPLIEMTPEIESFFFNQPDGNVEKYRQQFPPVNDRQLAIEKTPRYFDCPRHDIPEKIKSAIPNVKLLLIVCDPTLRAFSDYVHERARYKLFNAKRVAKYETFDDYVETFLPKVKKLTDNWTESTSATVGPTLTNLFREDLAAGTLISSSLYTFHIERWWRKFNHSNLMVIDGRKFLDDPGSVMEDVQTFLGLPQVLLREDFVLRPSTGFYCYRHLTPSKFLNQTEEVNEADLKCLNERKGRTAHGRKRPSQSATEKLRAFYRPFNRRFYRQMNKDYGWL